MIPCLYGRCDDKSHDFLIKLIKVLCFIFSTKLLSGTYGPRAVKEIPRPRPGRGRGMSRGGSRGSSGYATPTGRGRGRGGGPSGPPVQSKPVMSPLAEEPEPEREVGAVRFGGVRSRSQDFLNQEKPPRFDDFVDALSGPL